MELLTSVHGAKLMRQWGVEGWEDPGAEYFLWKNACVFAFVPQDGFFDVHMAMDARRYKDCREAGAEMLKYVGHNRLRAIILTDRPRVCNYASRMGFDNRTTETMTTINGSSAPFFIMWREPGEYHGRCNKRNWGGGK